MAQPKRWSRGEFCWYELGTTEIDRARSFYTSLLGWTTQDVPMGPMGIYTLFRHDGQDLAGMYKLEGPQFQGVPPHWMTYVATENVDADTAKARSLGATVHCEPMDVPNVGRMASIQDPQGAMISLFQAGQHAGSGRWDGAPSTFCWSELMTRDTDAAEKFYTGLFGWGAKASKGPQEYTEWQIAGRSIGGLFKLEGPRFEGVPSHWLNYLAVTDCDATAARAKTLGATVHVPPQDIPGVGRFSVLADPQGAHFALYTRR